MKTAGPNETINADRSLLITSDENGSYTIHAGSRQAEVGNRENLKELAEAMKAGWSKTQLAWEKLVQGPRSSNGQNMFDEETSLDAESFFGNTNSVQLDSRRLFEASDQSQSLVGDIVEVGIALLELL